MPQALGVLGSLAIDIGANLAGFQSDLGRADRIAQQRMRSIEATVKNTVTAISVAASTAAVAASVAVRRAIERADDLSKLSQKVGIATDELSKLNFAAQLSDVDTSGLQTALVKLSKTSQDLSDEAAAAFRSVGVSVKDADGKIKPTLQLVEELADGFAKFEDGAGKTAAAVAIFGKSGADMIPLLNGGASAIRGAGDELERLGGVVTPQAGRAAEAFNDNITRLQVATGGAANQVAQQLLPSLERLSDYLVIAAKDSDSAARAADGVRIAVGALAVPVITLWNALQLVGESFAAVAAAAGALARGDFAALDAIGEAFGEDKRKNLDDIANGYRLFLGAVDAGTGVLSASDAALRAEAEAMEGFGAKAGAATKPTLDFSAALEKVDSTSRKTREALDEYHDFRKRIFDEQKQRDEAELERMEKAVAFADELIRRANQMDLGKMTDAIRRAGEQGGFGAFGRVQGGITSAQDAERERALADRLRLEQDFEQKLLTQEQYNGAIEAAEREHQDRMAEIERAGQDAKRDMYGKAFDALSNLGSDFQASVLAQSKKGFEISKAISIIQATVKSYEAATSSYAALAGIPVVGPALGAAAAAAAITFGLAQVAAIKQTNFQGRRFGGPVAAGSMYEVNEDGPELLRTGNRTLLMMGRADGYVSPIKPGDGRFNTAGGGGEIKVVVNNYEAVDVGVDSRTDVNGARIIEVQVRKDLAENGPMSRDLARTFGLSRRAMGRG